MTNREQVLKSIQTKIPPHPMPWTPRELRRFWVIARQAGVSRDEVHSIIEGHYPDKRTLHDLTRFEFVRLMDNLFHRNNKIPDLDAQHGNIADGQWRKIRYLQRRLKWTDAHLVNYITDHGHISHIRFLNCDIARAVITGMVKIETQR